jgi:hypothetical protein
VSTLPYAVVVVMVAETPRELLSWGDLVNGRELQRAVTSLLRPRKLDHAG